jgi:hypothetical protein
MVRLLSLAGTLWTVLLVAILGARFWPTAPTDALVFDYVRFLDWGVYVYDMDRDLYAPYQNDPLLRERGATWSPDGETMLFINFRPSSVITLHRRGQAEPVVDDIAISSVFWGADSRTAYWLEPAGRVGQVDVLTGEVTTGMIPNASYLRPGEFAPVGADDALVLASLPSDPSPRPYLLDLNKLTLRPIANRELGCSQGTPQAVVPSPDGSLYALSCRFTTNLYLVDAEAEARRVLVSDRDLPGGVRRDIRWSPDGTRILFTYIPVGQTDPAVAVVEVTTGEVRHTLGAFVPGRVEWMPEEALYGR